ncbi:cysteine-rich receptor-like protein kinase 29 [Eucalyptus grandis]|uniref:cysteine-rich receptor-like protein kinase 29 n=1 Tax=Eucalyptus grandis TaxID=71139 RepID=UPI00192ED304|nr:cysteine-rich receptor-like protein kinase 29 [Eucalyptus grandis]
MDSPNLLLLLLLVFASTINAQFPATYCGSTGNFTANSTYQTTLTTLVSSISTTNSSSLSYGFFNASAAISGAFQTLYLFGLCRSDLNTKTCRACLDVLASDMRRLCPLQKEALLYSGNCIIRYSDASFFGVVVLQPDYVAGTGDDVNVSSADTYDAARMKLLNGLSAEAARGGSLRKYASGNESAGPDMVYALVQCTPDLTEQQCSECLALVAQEIRYCCLRYSGGRYMVPSCLILYGNNRFFDPVSGPLPPPPPRPSQDGDAMPPPPVGKSNSTRTVIIVVITSISALLVISIVILLLNVKRKKKQPRESVEGEVVDEISTAESLQFDFSTAESLQFDFSIIRAATDNFSDSRKLGQGGFGAVYMGRLSNGLDIAVKRLSSNSSQGEVEFKNEVMLLARLQHRNLVRLLGFCLEGIERLLIYEFLPNSSLDQIIIDPLKRANLFWDKRHKIIMGVARGLLYLHEDSRLRIIHRDVKAGNILLDSDMDPKISDFGTARLFDFNQTQANTNRIVGTYGYRAPEYAMYGNFSVKSDVFSFGVLILEIVSGQRKNLFHMGDNTVAPISYIWNSWNEGSISNIIDPLIIFGSRTEIERCIHVGLLCVQENVAQRPTMASVLLMLSHSITLPVPSRPPLC